IERVVVAALLVLRLVVERAAVNLHLTRGEVPLEVRHVVLGVPETPLDEREELEALLRGGLVLQGDLMHLAVLPDGHEEQDRGAQAVTRSGDARVAEAVPALVVVQLLLGGTPRRAPYVAALVEVEVATARVRGHVVVPIARDPTEPRVSIETVSPRLV